jgi:hypothetical protein
MLLADTTLGGLKQLDLRSALDGLSLNAATPQVVQFDPHANYVLVVGRRNEQFAFVVIDVLRPDQPILIPPPDTYSPISDVTRELALAPGGSYLALAEYDRTAVKERLWLFDVEAGQWNLIIERPAEYIPNRIHWSQNGRWIAWSYSGRDVQGQYYLYVAFYDLQHAVVSREYSFLEAEPFVPNTIVGWTTDGTGNGVLAILESHPDRGLVLLDPSAPGALDSVLMGYDWLRSQLPFPPETATHWSWRP